MGLATDFRIERFERKGSTWLQGSFDMFIFSEDGVDDETLRI
jgi:hypothetical protein